MKNHTFGDYGNCQPRVFPNAQHQQSEAAAEPDWHGCSRDAKKSRLRHGSNSRPEAIKTEETGWHNQELSD